MKLDFENKKFISDDGDGKIGEVCIKILNNSIGVPQIINLSFNDVALDLKSRKIHFAVASGSNLTQALSGAAETIFAQIAPEKIFCIVMLLVINAAVPFEQIETNVTAFEKANPQIKMHLGIAQNNDCKHTSYVYIIVAEK